ncbi:hypothetical protein [Kitasatospora sp. NPDC057198]|uniref:hypothetical protein n=1 Tax=Kitasatospora sp. NPDC057198 TaxID=3346046 RepID=UPI00364095C9
MRAPEELHLVDWPRLEHPYGELADLGDLLRALYGEDEEAVAGALEEVYWEALDLRPEFPVRAAVVPYLAHAAVHATHQRGEVLTCLALAAGKWAGDGLLAAELPGLLHLLRDEDPEVRYGAVLVARWAEGRARPLAVAGLAERLRADPVERVRAEALAALSRLEEEPAGRLRAALADRAPAVRATAALGLLEAAELPYPDDLLAVLSADGGGSAFTAGVDLGVLKVREVLDRDAASTRTVAAVWIEAGDVDGRGSRPALRLADTWRDQEASAVALLVDALPRQPDGHRRTAVLEAMARWVAACPDPAPAADAALPLVDDPERKVAREAQLVLGRAGDRRLLTDVPRLALEALDALAARTGDPELRRRVLTPRPCTCGRCEPAARVSADRVLAALTPPEAAALLPELLALLRVRPNQELVRLLGATGRAEPELLSLLGELAAAGDRSLAPAAAAAAVRLGADPGPALGLFTDRLGADGWTLADAALLGPAGRPLLPLVEGHLANGNDWHRAHAAEALWRITGDPARAVPVLLDLLVPLPVGVFALDALRRTGAPLPPAARAVVRGWADGERKVLRGSYDRNGEDAVLRAAARLLLAAQG